MEKKKLLLITKNKDLVSGIKSEAGFSYELVTVKNVHTGYSLALSHLPDVILIDHTSIGSRALKNLRSFKSTHFLNKTLLFVYGNRGDSDKLDTLYSDDVDGMFYDTDSYSDILREIEHTGNLRKCLTNYWRDSFMGLFNLLGDPVVLLQDEEIIAVNDAFKKYFFVSKPENVKVTDLLDCKNKFKVLEILRNFVRGKHMKASTMTSLVMNNKLREAKITFSKLDKTLRGQMVMMINFAENEVSLNPGIGTVSKETQEYFENNNSVGDLRFTKREKEIISLLCKGYKTREISEALCISSKTIEKHRSNIIRRTHSDTILESVVYALNHNMIEIDGT